MGQRTGDMEWDSKWTDLQGELTDPGTDTKERLQFHSLRVQGRHRRVQWMMAYRIWDRKWRGVHRNPHAFCLAVVAIALSPPWPDDYHSVGGGINPYQGLSCHRKCLWFSICRKFFVIWIKYGFDFLLNFLFYRWLESVTIEPCLLFLCPQFSQQHR